MKYFWFIAIFILIARPSFSQEKLENLKIHRDSIYSTYRAHVDTMTINTWINIMTANRQLEQLRIFDSTIIAYLNEITPAVDSSIALRATLDELQVNNNILEVKNQDILADKDYYQRIFGLSIFGLAFFFILIIILFIVLGRLTRSVKQKERTLNKSHSELSILKESIEKYGVTENHLLSEINKIKKQHTLELEALSQSKVATEDEKLMLENQMIEIRKAYGFEVQKRRELETTIAENPVNSKEMESEMAEQITNLNNTLKGAQSEVERMKQELKLLASKEAENLRITDELSKLKLEYENEVNTRLRTEQELQSLIERLRNHFD